MYLPYKGHNYFTDFLQTWYSHFLSAIAWTCRWSKESSNTIYSRWWDGLRGGGWTGEGSSTKTWTFGAPRSEYLWRKSPFISNCMVEYFLTEVLSRFVILQLIWSYISIKINVFRLLTVCYLNYFSRLLCKYHILNPNLLKSGYSLKSWDENSLHTLQRAACYLGTLEILAYCMLDHEICWQRKYFDMHDVKQT